MTITVVERPPEAEDGASTQPQVDQFVGYGAWGTICQYALPLAFAGILTLTPNVSANTTNRPHGRDEIVYRADSATYRQPIPSLSARGWAFAQRVSDAAREVAITPVADEDDEYLVEPPDASIWENVPATSWT